MDKQYQILIIESSDTIRRGLTDILKALSCINRIDQAATWENYLEQKTEMNYDLVLLNPLACCRGPRLRPQVTEKFESAVLIGIISTVYDRGLHHDYEELIYLTDGEEEIQNMVVRLLSKKNTGLSAHKILSAREIEVLKQFALGQTVKEIADALHISAHTVVSHRKNISTKLGIKTTSGMAIYAVTAKIVDASEIIA